MENTTHTGIVPRITSWLFGERAARLTERASRAHWLSYLLILSQSIAVVLVLGHAELPLLLTGSWAIRALASMGLFVLIATVFASDLALLETLRRIPVLARNRQRAQLREHVLYVAFVLLVEASTYAVVMAALDRDPQALITAKPLIPTAGPIFWTQVLLRAVLVCWTAIQLVLVRGKLPVLLSTLTSTGKELVGAHVEKQLAALDIAGVTLPDMFRTYAAMARPPRRVRTRFNGWLADHELAGEAEEERQVSNVVGALEELEKRRKRTMSQPEEPSVRTPDNRPPTGPGTPTVAPREEPAVRTDDKKVVEMPQRQAQRTRRQTAARASTKKTVRTASQRQQEAAQKRTQRLAQIAAWLSEEPTIGARELTRKLQQAEHSRVSESTVNSLRRQVEAGGMNTSSSQQYAQ